MPSAIDQRADVRGQIDGLNKLRTDMPTATELHTARLSRIRGQLENLAQRRYMTGLALSEEVRYEKLCVSERALLDRSPL